MVGPRLVVILACLWLAVGGLYLWAAAQQKQRLNLSATAGGQYPYLICAERMAKVGVGGYFGDRNRMPLYPALLASVYDQDWDRFVKRSAWLAIVSSMVMLVGIGWVSYHVLAPWPATALTLTAVVCVFIHKASFVQAELLYYALLLGSWLLLCRLIRRPSLWRSIVAGVLLGATYLTKASALPVVVVFVAAMGLLAVVLGAKAKREGQRQTSGHLRGAGSDPPISPLGKGNPPLSPLGKGGCRGVAGPDDQPIQNRDAHVKRERSDGGGESQSPRPVPVLITAAVVLLSFIATVSPYLSANKAQFGRYFYNVNSTFFMWCDNWAQAKAFADAQRISDQYPTAPREQIPGLGNYWRTHTVGQIFRRLGSGLVMLWSLAVEGCYFKYLIVTVAFCLVLGARQLSRVKELRIEDWAVLTFCALLLVVYSLAYAWYAQVAYGDRFILSLFLPSMCAALWLSEKLSAHGRLLSLFGRRARTSDVLSIVMVVVLIGEGVVTATTTLHRPSRTFVQFYYNESRALLDAGNVPEAAKGFAGVIRLDPSYAPAHHALGMLAMDSGRFEDAAGHLAEVVRLDPLSADGHNSLGSALLQTGRTKKAIAEFEEAIRLDPGFTSAWYNLGGSYYLAGRFDEAKAVRKRLQELDTELARKLGALIEK